MRYPIELVERAKKLRAEGKMYPEIREIIGKAVPKSTLSFWCSKVALPAWYQAKIDELNKKSWSIGRKHAWIAHRQRKNEFINSLLKNNLQLVEKLRDKDVAKMLLAMLYLGEGSKSKSHSGLSLGSSDPTIIKIYIKLLNICYGITKNKFGVWIGHRADQNLKSLQTFWSEITGIPLRRFYNSKPDARTVGKPTLDENYKGVCAISCAGSNYQLELEMIANIIALGL